MNKTLKDTILFSVKIAASFSKDKASIEDFLLALIKNNSWFSKTLDYIWINPIDIETNLVELNQNNFIDWISNKEQDNEEDEPLDKIIWEITKNLFWNQENNSTPFDWNKPEKV